MADILATAKSTYGPLYKRKKEAEHLRRVLHLLDRHKFLLNLPASMKESMDRGDVRISNNISQKSIYLNYMSFTYSLKKFNTLAGILFL